MLRISSGKLSSKPGSVEMWKFVLAVVIPLVSLHSVNAASPYPKDVLIEGRVQRAVVDTNTGLEWLSPRATLNLRVPEVLDPGSAWVRLGFRNASANELTELLRNYGVTFADDTVDRSTVGAAQKFVEDIGWTYVNNEPSSPGSFGQKTVYGVLSDPILFDGQVPASRTQSMISVGELNGYVMLRGQWKYTASDNLVGYYLVRQASAVDEPQAILLVCFALPTLLLLRRGQRAS
jgi:hypothetical protein